LQVCPAWNRLDRSIGPRREEGDNDALREETVLTLFSREIRLDSPVLIIVRTRSVMSLKIGAIWTGHIGHRLVEFER